MDPGETSKLLFQLSPRPEKYNHKRKLSARSHLAELTAWFTNINLEDQEHWGCYALACLDTVSGTKQQFLNSCPVQDTAAITWSQFQTTSLVRSMPAAPAATSCLAASSATGPSTTTSVSGKRCLPEDVVVDGPVALLAAVQLVAAGQIH